MVCSCIGMGTPGSRIDRGRTPERAWCSRVAGAEASIMRARFCRLPAPDHLEDSMRRRSSSANWSLAMGRLK